MNDRERMVAVLTLLALGLHLWLLGARWAMDREERGKESDGE